jgi:hypothetical protein
MIDLSIETLFSVSIIFGAAALALAVFVFFFSRRRRKNKRYESAFLDAEAGFINKTHAHGDLTKHDFSPGGGHDPSGADPSASGGTPYDQKVTLYAGGDKDPSFVGFVTTLTLAGEAHAGAGKGAHGVYRVPDQKDGELAEIRFDTEGAAPKIIGKGSRAPVYVNFERLGDGEEGLDLRSGSVIRINDTVLKVLIAD